MKLVIPFSDKVSERKKGEGHSQHAKVPPEFKQQAVELHRKSDTTYAEVARGPGVDPGSLSSWAKRADRRVEDDPESQNPFQTPGCLERHLRRRHPGLRHLSVTPNRETGVYTMTSSAFSTYKTYQAKAITGEDVLKLVILVPYEPRSKNKYLRHPPCEWRDRRVAQPVFGAGRHMLLQLCRSVLSCFIPADVTRGHTIALANAAIRQVVNLVTA